MLSRPSVWRNFDFWLLAAVILLTGYGVLMIRSAVTGAPAFETYPSQQAIFAVIGLVVLFAVAAIDYRYLTSAHWYIYAGVVASLVLVIVAGQLGNEARRWIQITPTFRIQPSEFGRILIAVTFAQFLATRQHLITRFSNTLLSLVYIGIPVGLIFLQPDLGMSILFMFVWFIMIWAAGLPVTHFVVIGAVGIAGIILIYPSLAEYQQERVTTFLNPDEASEDDRFNIEQAEISVGSGGLFGKGYMQGTQSQLGFLRVQHTDFIFSMITEEMGLVYGSLVVIALLGFILLRILRAAALSTDFAGKLICLGIAAILFFQTVVSIGMNVRILPVTGLTLPFVSYGGSSLVTLFLAIGIVESVLMRQRRQEFG